MTVVVRVVHPVRHVQILGTAVLGGRGTARHPGGALGGGQGHRVHPERRHRVAVTLTLRVRVLVRVCRVRVRSGEHAQVVGRGEILEVEQIVDGEVGLAAL